MSNSPTVHFEFADTTVRSMLRYESGDSEQLALTVVGQNLRRLEESSFVGEAVYGDIIRVSEADDGALMFLEVAERSTLVSKNWIMSADTLGSPGIKAILTNVMKVGGMWEQAFGGLLIVHVPPDFAETIFQQIDKSHV